MEKLIDKIKERVNKSDVMCNGYFYDFRKNVFTGKMDEKYISMFLHGDGSELVSKACAPHSSSMLGYNFFHWINKEHKLTITFNDKKEITYNEVLFEVKIPVLKGKKEANMDIVLRNNKTGEWLFIESKFTEYLNRGKFKMSDSYRNESSYFKKDYRDKWTRIIDSISGSSKETGYWDGIKQEICHLIGLTNWLDKCVKIKDKEYGNLIKKKSAVVIDAGKSVLSHYPHLHGHPVSVKFLSRTKPVSAVVSAAAQNGDSLKTDTAPEQSLCDTFYHLNNTYTHGFYGIPVCH